MTGNKLSALCALALGLGTLLLGGCAATYGDPTADWTTNKLYTEAKDELNAGNYEKSIPLYEKLEGRAAGTPIAQQAQLDKAYAHYKNADPVLAVAALDRFIKLHPASPALDYALYFKGVVNFNDDLGLFSALTRQDLSERDQKSAKESFQSFNELVTRFPQSKYAADASKRMAYIVNSLAQSEVHVARYYYQRKAYLAAINRAQIALTDYQGVPALEEALFIMVKSYDAMNMPSLRDDAKRVLETNYPQSTFLTLGYQPNTGPWWKLW